MTRVLLIGANGFLGAHVKRALTGAAGTSVVTAGRSASCDFALDLVTGGVAGVLAALEQAEPDVVVNCAGKVAGPPDVLAEGNITGPANLVGALLTRGCATRLVHLGSAGEYGRVEVGTPITERTRPCPVGVYGVTKLAGTAVVSAGRAAGLDAVVLRVFNPFGPGSPVGSLPGRLATQLRQAIAEGTDVHLGALDDVRDFVDARDVAEAVLAVCQASTVDTGVLNVASGRATPVRQLVTTLADIAGFTGVVVEQGVGSARSAEVPWHQADISTIGELLGWKPGRDLTTSLTDLWQATT
ncbi:NAD-dependent epimerase/dehydratase family protein [Kutzneria viridogrisea]|uniref:NDP-hexose 4-ketoreductase n=2 Tax=Kutzneria TaxID=43356 RepID=W5W2M8_9PSEU|nr:NAD(P)-dependent oxidoreductase [Kutzneria albida]AHH95438.1 NDP-hexose 4-ketoreductase [Kutzneria albida DSM 43870]MBA8927203.1 nucleoside-diphosphate-sugar epimerase [Kutzneria viridogrisea]